MITIVTDTVMATVTVTVTVMLAVIIYSGNR